MKGFYSGKRVFITGHTGFKGSWLSIWLSKLGAEVTGFALEPPTKPSMFELCSIENNISSVTGDVRNREALTEVMKSEKPEIVFHLAAQPLVRLSYENPVETYEINVMGTVNLLEAVRECPSVKAVVIVTSDKCYENAEQFWGYRENDRLGGYDPYSSSKACCELVVDAYRNSFFNVSEYMRHGVAIATARAGNVIGGGDFALDRLIPDFIRSVIEDKPLEVRNRYAIRPWQHVMEPLYGYMSLAQRLYMDGTEYSGAWNFGPDNTNIQTVEWMISSIYRLWGKRECLAIVKNQGPHETGCLKLDSYKARQLLGFESRMDAEQALKMVVEWTKAYLNSENLYNVTIKQINEYGSIS